MKNILLATAATVALSGAAFAAMVDVDTDGDGMASMAELMVKYPDLTEENFAAIDVNGDGKVDDTEMTAAMEGGLLTEE